MFWSKSNKEKNCGEIILTSTIFSRLLFSRVCVTQFTIFLSSVCIKILLFFNQKPDLQKERRKNFPLTAPLSFVARRCKNSFLYSIEFIYDANCWKEYERGYKINPRNYKNGYFFLFATLRRWKAEHRRKKTRKLVFTYLLRSFIFHKQI